MPSELIGHTDRISVTPGEAIAFKVSTDFDQYDGAIVRLIHGDANGPGFKEEMVRPDEGYRGRKQRAHCGSYGLVPDHPALSPQGSFTLLAWIYPTTPYKGTDQGILAKWSGDEGFALVLGHAGHVRAQLGRERHG